MSTKKTAHLGLFAAVAIIFGYVDTLLPVFTMAPGIKLGLANLAAVYLLYTYTWKEAGFVSFIRILVIGFLFGSFSTILYSLAGAGLSLLCMTAAKRGLGLSVIGVSILGGITHNLGQIFVASLIMENANLFYYFPVLLVAGLITGLLIGIVSGETLKRMAGRKQI